MKVLEFPLARITISFLLGILTSYFLLPNPNLIWKPTLVLLLLLSLLYFGTKTDQKFKLFFSITTYLVSFFIGISSLIVQTESFRKTNYSNYESAFKNNALITLIIREPLKDSYYNQRYIAIVQTIDNKNYSGRVLINIPKKGLRKKLEVGTIAQIKGQLQKNKKPENPNQFDYSNYLKNKQIYAQLYANPATIKISTELQKNIWYYTAKLNSKITQNLEKTHFNKEALAVATALLLGQRQDISPDILQNYQYAGAIHILSVSGLHVGIIFLFLNFILKPIPNTKKGSLLKLGILLTCLFSFALIAGLSASIVRSVTMFSFVAIGLHLKRSVNIYHTLIVSILLILLFQPNFLFDVGFQLSYLAVFFIIWFQPILTSYWKPKNKILKYIWNILTVSFTAQIGTLPLSLYYFHQFPGLFFITNLIVIPLLSIIMLLGVITILLAATGWINIWLSKPFEWSILLLNKIINFIASFEQFIIKDIPFNLLLLICTYALIITAILWLKKPQFNKLLLVLLTIITLQSSLIYNRWTIQNQEEWIVFNLKRKTLIAHRTGRAVSLYTNDSIATKNPILKSYLINNFSYVDQIKPIKHTAYYKSNKILILDSIGIYPLNAEPDIVLLTKTPKINLDRVLTTLKPKLIIADGSNYKSILEQWKRSCEKQNIPFHATAEKGYFLLN